MTPNTDCYKVGGSIQGLGFKVHVSRFWRRGYRARSREHLAGLTRAGLTEICPALVFLVKAPIPDDALDPATIRVNQLRPSLCLQLELCVA